MNTPRAERPASADRPRRQISVGRVLTLAAAVVLAAFVDDRLTVAGITLPFLYLIPIGIAATGISWRAALAVIAIAALANGALDQSRAEALANIATVHLISVVFFLLMVPIAAGLSAIGLGLGYLRLGNHWRAALDPIRVGDRIVILPAGQPNEAANAANLGPDDIALRMDPGMAFGSGSHPTTQMCVGLLEAYTQPGQTIFDLGSGTGVLAIAAVKLGAASALAADVDPEAERKTRLNIGLNNLAGRITFRLGSLEAAQAEWPPVRYDIVIANILADVLVDLLEKGLAGTVAPGGALILSGIRAEREAAIAEALGVAGFGVAERRETDGWVALLARPKSGE